MRDGTNEDRFYDSLAHDLQNLDVFISIIIKNGKALKYLPISIVCSMISLR